MTNEQKILDSEASIEVYFVSAFYIQLVKINGTFALPNTNNCLM